MYVHSPEEISSLPEEEVYAALGTRPEGLTEQETLALRAECGPNVVPEPSGQPLAIRFLSQLGHFLALLLWLDGALAFIAGMPELGWAIFAVILIMLGLTLGMAIDNRRRLCHQSRRWA